MLNSTLERTLGLLLLLCLRVCVCQIARNLFLFLLCLLLDNYSSRIYRLFVHDYVSHVQYRSQTFPFVHDLLLLLLSSYCMSIREQYF